jgi:fructose-bisphosphate aldolase, class II
MTLATLTDVLRPCLDDGTAVAGFVVLGWEDAVAFVRAAEAEARPVILQAGPGARAHTPLPVLGAMFRTLAEGASVPVVAHLDHGEGIAVCAQAIDCGFTSVMYDGSALSFGKNVSNTAEIAGMAHRHGVSVEAELGYVGYHQGAASRGTDLDEIAQFASLTGVDALAVSVGNSHLMDAPGASVDLALLGAMARAAPLLPLVLHGGSGIAPDQRRLIAAQTTVCKFNIGTTLRMVFGAALRDAVNRDPARFDRVQILSDTIDPMVRAARAAIASLGPPKN